MSYESTHARIGMVGIFTVFALTVTMAAGWITNIVWTFHQTDIARLILGILGAFIAPIGAIHGIALWF